MDIRTTYQTVIKRVLQEHAAYRAQAQQPVRPYVVCDDEGGHYLLMEVGWNGDEYWHETPIHLDLIDDKIWIQCDDTEDGIATDLMVAGVPNYDIVLGFRPPDLRHYTGFGVGTNAPQTSESHYAPENAAQAA